MKAADTTEDPGTTARAVIAQRISHFFERRAADDPDGQYAYAAPDVVYRVGSYRAYPFQVERRGREACLEMARIVNVQYQNLGSVFHDMVIDGDLAAFRRTAMVRNRGSGRTIRVEICDFFRFRNGLLVEIVEYPDTETLTQLDVSNVS